MRDDECVELLRWALPRLRMRWPGYRRVHRQVCRRIARRIAELGLAGPAAYREHLERHSGEWRELDALTCITISRFYRDRGAFGSLEREVLPALARHARERGAGRLEAWSAGCASGEEPYTLALVWDLAVGPAFPGLELRVLATDVEPTMLRRAREACYRESSLRELPESWRAAFVREGELYGISARHRQRVEILAHDIRDGAPNGPFDLILCRNLAFTYFDSELQLDVGRRLTAALRPGGALMVGSHESVPEGVQELEPWPGARGLYRARA
jgi:chemotaxis protein methyltransferase CheR